MTGITQEQVDGGIDIKDAMNNCHAWLESEGMFQSEFVFMSCGDFDGNAINREAKIKNFNVPNYLKRWINLKKAFPKYLFDETAQAKNFNIPKTIKNCKPVVNSMEHMLTLTDLELEGRHHSGIDDAKNLARVAIKCLESGYEFT